MTEPIDESLFGVRDFGKITLVQVKTIHEQMYERYDHAPSSIAEWLKCSDFWFMMFRSPNVYPKALASVKYKQMVEQQAFSEHEYRVKFDIRHLTTPDVFAIDLWIDDILMYIYIRDYIEFETVSTLNAAHKTYLHDLYYAEFRANMARIAEELVAAAMHPRRLTRYLELGGEIDDW